MPDYVYTDGEHTAEVSHRMLYTTGIICDECGAEMWRVPQPVMVNWDGLPPSREAEPWVSDFVEDTPRRREEVERKYDDDDRRILYG